MLAKRIIPCLDIKDSRTVKGVNFVDLIDAGDPVEQAQLYDQAGADELCFLDITASSDNRDTIYDVVTRTVEKCFMPVTVGGGIRSISDIRKLLLAGADKVAINTAAIKDPGLVKKAALKFGSQCIVISMDVKQKDNNFELFTHGGRTETGIDALTWAKKMVDFGAGEILLTSMDKDGTQQGFDLEITRQIADNVSIPVIASGGVGHLQHLVDGVKKGHANGVLAASIFHFGLYTIREAKNFMNAAGVAVRVD